MTEPIDAPGPDTGGVPLDVPLLVLEGVETSDRRVIEPGALTPRATPLPFAGQREVEHGGEPGGAPIVGRLDALTRVDASAMVHPVTGEPYGQGAWAWTATGSYLDTPEGREFAALAATKAVRGVSVDLAVTDWETEITEVDEDGWPTNWLDRVLAGEIMGATQHPHAAFAGAYVVVDPQAAGVDAPAEPVAASVMPGLLRLHYPEPQARPLVASGDWRPDPALFADPRFGDDDAVDGRLVRYTGRDEAPAYGCPLTVTPDRRVFGHVAVWGLPHTGYPGRAPVYAPRSATGYAHYLTGAVLCSDGSTVAVGRIAVDTVHPDDLLDAQAAVRHYADTGTGAALINVGEDLHGIWAAGVCPPWVPDDVVGKLRAHPPSGDWRPYGRGLELVHVLAVNSPGFPMPRARVASGRVVALVAAGAAPLARVRARTSPALASVVRDAVGEALEPLLRRDREHRAAAALARIRRR